MEEGKNKKNRAGQRGGEEIPSLPPRLGTLWKRARIRVPELSDLGFKALGVLGA